MELGVPRKPFRVTPPALDVLILRIIHRGGWADPPFVLHSFVLFCLLLWNLPTPFNNPPKCEATELEVELWVNYDWLDVSSSVDPRIRSGYYIGPIYKYK